MRTRISTDTDEPRPAITHFETQESLPDYTLLRVRLETGRTHQIRAHLKAIGHPVAGDPEYGGRKGELGLTRQFLHADRLAFAHPVTGAAVDVRSPLPETSATRSRWPGERQLGRAPSSDPACAVDDLYGGQLHTEIDSRALPLPYPAAVGRRDRPRAREKAGRSTGGRGREGRPAQA